MKVVFVGPSLGNDIGRQRQIHSDVEFRAPAACGDILRAAEDGASAIGLVDGYFGDLPSVWHKEILYALENGIAIGGGASMGALRAAECSPFGMVGIGGIYEDYASGALMDDEAVALVHGPAEMNWTPLSIPWVDFEPTMEKMHSEGHMTAREWQRMLMTGRVLHFSERTYPRVIRECAFENEQRGRALLQAIRQGRIERKRADALAVLDWLAADTSVAQRTDWNFMATSHWEMLRSEVIANRLQPAL